jgi:hypothetical protein
MLSTFNKKAMIIIKFFNIDDMGGKLDYTYVDKRDLSNIEIFLREILLHLNYII